MLGVIICWPKLLHPFALGLKASLSRKQCRKSAYNLVKTKNRSRKQSHKKGDGIGVGRTSQKVSIFFWLRLDSVAYNLVKTKLLESEAEAEGPITMHVLTLCDWPSSPTSACDPDNLALTWS